MKIDHISHHSQHHGSHNTMSKTKDDSFQLYDLRVEVVCPPGERIMCGAKEGDYFTVRGEMLHLPDGQGISFYSLGMCQTVAVQFRD